MPEARRPCFSMSTKPQLRSAADRVRQVILFEVGGLLLITPPFVWASGVSIEDSLGLLAVIALLAALWNAAYNTAFDCLDARFSGRNADCRPFPVRVLHALGFELTLLLISLPIIMWWTDMGWLEALLADAGLAIAYTLYAFVFNLGYDRLFPITPKT